MNSPETRLHIAIMKWWSGEYRELGCPHEALLFHVPNGGQRSKRSGAIFKAMGVRSGIPDLLLAYPRHGYSMLALELKAPGRKLGTKQEDIRALFIAQSGWWVERVSELERAIFLFRHYFAARSDYFIDAHG